MKLWAVLVAIGAAIVLATVAFTAQGVPSQPVVVSPVTPNPSVSQSITLFVTAHVFSTQPPNSIDLLGARIAYSIYQGKTPLAFQQTAGMGLVSSNGADFQIGTAVTVTAPALCSPSACTGITDNITFVGQVQVPTYVGAYFSPVTTVTFSNVPAYNDTGNPPAGTDASPNQWYFNTFGALTGIVFVVTFLVAGFMWRPAIGVAVFSGLALVGMVLVWL